MATVTLPGNNKQQIGIKCVYTVHGYIGSILRHTPLELIDMILLFYVTPITINIKWNNVTHHICLLCPGDPLDLMSDKILFKLGVWPNTAFLKGVKYGSDNMYKYVCIDKLKLLPLDLIETEIFVPEVTVKMDQDIIGKYKVETKEVSNNRKAPISMNKNQNTFNKKQIRKQFIYIIHGYIRSILKYIPSDITNLILFFTVNEKHLIEQYYVAVLQHVAVMETFYIRTATYSEIFDGKYKINMNAYTFMNYFQFKQRNVTEMEYLNLIIKCVNISDECEWAVWTKNIIKLDSESGGYWQSLSIYDNEPKVSVDHLDCILALLRHSAMNVTNKLLKNEKQYFSLVFLKANRDKLNDNNALDQGLEISNNNNNNEWTENDVEAEYQLTFWNGTTTGNSSLSLKLIKTAHATIDEKTEESHFIQYNSNDKDVKWLWYMNDTEYELSSCITKQLEATYQGVSEEIFPLQYFKRETEMNSKERAFDYAQLPNISSTLVDSKGFEWKPFMLRFKFPFILNSTLHGYGGKTINIKQMTIISYDDEVQVKVKRIYSGKSDVTINNEKYGEMNVYQSDKSIIICWKFEQNAEIGIIKTYHYKVEIAMFEENKFHRVLACWRANTLFHPSISNKSVIIRPSKVWETDEKMASINEIIHDNGVCNGNYAVSKGDDDNDIEQKEECIICQMIVCKKEKTKENNSGISGQLPQIEKYHDLHENSPISDDDWILLDKLDDKQRETVNSINKKPEYQQLSEEQRVWEIWKEKHDPHKFRKKLYRLVSLTFIQSIISVIKNDSDKIIQKQLIIVISDEQQIYEQMFNLNPSKDYISSKSKSFSFLFDGEGDIKRIDSNKRIYSINIKQLQKEIIDKGYLHEFISMSSIKFKETLILFTRPNDPKNNLYISHNGCINKLSLKLHYEDLYYFIPSFIPLKIGDYVNIEAFSSADSGTIISLWRDYENNDIVYKIRSRNNVYYIMNYYKLVNREQPQIYWSNIRNNVVENSSVWDGLKLWKTEISISINGDPSYPLHPLHSVILSLIESGKQSIKCIVNDKNGELNRLSLEQKLQNIGSIFLFYKSVKVEEKNEEVLDFEQKKKEEQYTNDTKDEDKNEESDIIESNPNGLCDLIEFLKCNKLIYNVQKYDKPKRVSYFDFCEKAINIWRENKNNKVFLCHMVETKRYELEEVETMDYEETINDDGDDWDSDSDFERFGFEHWEPFIPKEPPELRLFIRSTFECDIQYEFEMCSVHIPILTVEDIMMKQSDKEYWTTDDHNLLTQFHHHNIWNQFDLLDKQLITKLKSEVNKNNNINKKQLFENKIETLLKHIDINHALPQYAICGVQVTRNAKLLQQYIEEFKRFKSEEIGESNTDYRTMIISYNPIQTVVVTSTIFKDVTHPIHIYRAAYDEKFYPKDQIHELNTEWMQTCTRNANIINALSMLLRNNKKCDIILVPSWINLESQHFLTSQCKMIATNNESIARYKIIFLYKGLLYRYVGGLHDIQSVLRLLNDNISEQQSDELDLDETILFISRSQIIQRLTSQPSYSCNTKPKKNRLRASIKRGGSRDHMISKWLNIGCDTCLLCESNGIIMEIGDKTSTNYENELAKQLQITMFLYDIDCRIPYNDEIFPDENVCPICKQLMINPATIGNPKCPHIFCKLCIHQWYFVHYSPSINMDNCNSKCPLCRRAIREITVKSSDITDMNQGIPITIYQQIMEENQSFFLRQYLMDKYLEEIERVLQNETLHSESFILS